MAQSNLKEAELSYKAALSEEKGVEANLLAYEAALLSAKADLDDTNIYAPSDGVILTKVAELGEVLSPGGVLFTMVDLNKLYMKAYLPEELFGKIKIGSEARIYLDAYKDKYFEATVKEMNQQAEFTPKNIEVKDQRVKLVFGLKAYIKDNSAGEAKPGMPGDTRVKYEDNARW
ncbi:MAG: putative efflux pump membrane fusion protein [bacterium ADurb.Bin363]|nr:MAG: putative efflux pump membrane fusion protein [bacterium ADurb.Bin363]